MRADCQGDVNSVVGANLCVRPLFVLFKLQIRNGIINILTNIRSQMNTLQNIKSESVLLLRMKFLLVFGVLTILFVNVVAPILSVSLEFNPFSETPFETMIDNITDDEPLSYNGIIYDKNNRITFSLALQLSLYDEVKKTLARETLTLAQNIITEKIDFYARYADVFDDEAFLYYDGDYRIEAVTTVANYIAVAHLYRLENPDYDAIAEIIDKYYYFFGLDFNLETFKNMSKAEKQSELEKIEKDILNLNILIRENDFSKYAEIFLRYYENELANFDDKIENIEKAIESDPVTNGNLQSLIDEETINNNKIRELEISTLKYRLENNIVIDDGSWQDMALTTMSDNYNLIHLEYNSRDNFYEERSFSLFLDEWFDNYNNYSYVWEMRKLKGAHDYFVAEASLENGAPDMAVVPDGARNRVYGTFNSQFVLVFFAVLVGGYVMAAEYQLGTIRLLLIRPRVRLKVILTKYLGGVSLIYALIFTILLINLITHGVLYGFSDYLYQNYTINGEINFFAMLIGDVLSLSTVFLFVYSFAFSCSTLFKNIAVATILPVFLLVVSTFLMQYIDVNFPMPILELTPLPYISIHEFLVNPEEIAVNLTDKNLTTVSNVGVAVNLIYSTVFMLPAVLMFLKRDVN